MSDYLLKEDGDKLLQENGSFILKVAAAVQLIAQFGQKARGVFSRMFSRVN